MKATGQPLLQLILTILKLKRARELPRQFEADIDNNRSIEHIGDGRAKIRMHL
jgi:hypothetical protein